METFASVESEGQQLDKFLLNWARQRSKTGSGEQVNETAAKSHHVYLSKPHELELV